MDSVVSSVVGSVIENYFAIFFLNFKKENFSLNTALTSDSSTTLNNLEINTQVVQEVLGLSTLHVERMRVNTLTISVKVTKIRREPVVIAIDELTCVLNEPGDELTPIPKVLEEFMKKLPQTKQSYGLSEKIIDGFTITIKKVKIHVSTRGKYKSDNQGEWTPPKLQIELNNVRLFTTNHRWEVVDLKEARLFNEKKPEIFLFKQLDVESIFVDLVSATDETKKTSLLKNIPLRVQLVIRKQNDNQIKAVSTEVILNKFNANIDVSNLPFVVQFFSGISACFGRRDKPPTPPATVPHVARIFGFQIREWSVVVLSQEAGKGIELTGKNLRIGNHWAENNAETQKELEICVESLMLRDYSVRSGPSANYIFKNDTSMPSDNPRDEIPPILRTFHPTAQVYTVEKPLFYLKGILNPTPDLAFDVRLIINPFYFSFQPETISNVIDFVSSCVPQIAEVQRLYSLKPATAEEEVILVQEGKSFLEDKFAMHARIKHIQFAFPSSANDSDYVRVCLNIKDTQLVSHPSLKPTTMYESGLGALHTFPAAADDLIATKHTITERASHTVRIEFFSQVEWTVAFSEKESPVAAFVIPSIHFDLTFSLGALKQGITASGAHVKSKLEPLLLECCLWVASVEGKLTQRQYRAILSRIDQLLLLIPALQKLSSFNTNMEKPKEQLIFLLKIEEGKWILVDDTTTSTPSELACLQFNTLEVRVENTQVSQTAIVLLQSVQLNALPFVEDLPSVLFNPNSFIASGSDTPLLLVRVNMNQHPPGEILIASNTPTVSESADGQLVETTANKLRKYLTNRAFYDGGKRSLLDIRISGIHFGFNPNPACQILNFFLKSELNIKRMFTTLREAKQSLEKSLENVDIASTAKEYAEKAAEEFVNSVQKSFDIDVNVALTDLKVFFVQDFPLTSDNRPNEHALNGDIELSIAAIQFSKTAVGKYKQITKSRVDQIALYCNKEQNRIADIKQVFTPISGQLETTVQWDAPSSEWVISVAGGLDKVSLVVDPSHASIFMDVVHGIKMQNIQQVIDSIGTYVNQAKKELPGALESIQSAAAQYGLGFLQDSNTTADGEVKIEEVIDTRPVTASIETLHSLVNRAHSQIAQAKQENESLATSLKDLEEKTGEKDPLGQAIFKCNVKYIVNKKASNKVAAISKNGILYVFNNDKGGVPVYKQKISADTKITMVGNLPNCFQLSHAGSPGIALQTQDDLTLAQFTNELLKAQVAGDEKYADQTADSLTQVSHVMTQIKTHLDTISETAESMDDKVKLLNRIKALEDMVRERDAKLAALSK